VPPGANRTRNLQRRDAPPETRVKDRDVDEKYMRVALREAEKANRGGLLVLRRGGEALKNYRLNDTTLYVTAEPCAMCASALIHGRVSRLVFGAPEPKFGAVKSKMRLFEDHVFNHQVDVDHGVLEKECIEKIKTFFKKKREGVKNSKAESKRNIAEKDSGH
jgi:tRNA(adenine34) deaminase